MVRIGIVGCNYGRRVLLPAFRSDRRTEVVALAGTDAARAAALAREEGVPLAFGEWSGLVEHPDVDAIVIATPPEVQPAIALRALALGKPVFAEKPLATNLQQARAMCDRAHSASAVTMVDFEFPELDAWRAAKRLFDQGAIGRLRHLVVTWHCESRAAQLRLKNWKTDQQNGGGALGNFVSHSLYYLEWFAGPIHEISARLGGPPGAADEGCTVMLIGAFASGATCSLAMSCASYCGSGHRLEFYGDDGTLVLLNDGPDYFNGFKLHHAARSGTSFAPIVVEESATAAVDSRIPPVARLAGRFLDAIERRETAVPGFAEGYRVQQLLGDCLRSHHSGRVISTLPSTAG